MESGGEQPVDPKRIPPRLQEVARLGSVGFTDKQIAAELSLSVHTVEMHWRRLRSLFDAANRAQVLVRYAEWRNSEYVSALEVRQRLLEQEIERLQQIQAELRQAYSRIEATLEERDAAFIRIQGAQWRQPANQEVSAKRLREAVEHSGTVHYEGEWGGTWRKLWATRNVERFGFTAEEFSQDGSQIADRIHPSDLVTVHDRIQEWLKEGARQFVIYYRTRMPDGHYHWVRDHQTLVRDENGVFSRYFGAVTDVNDLLEGVEPASVHEMSRVV
jgi:PAS domain S-box-containing protein